MNLTLPDSLRDWVEAQASKAGKPPTEYVLDVLRKAQAGDDLDAWLHEGIVDAGGEDAATPEALDTCRRAIESKLIEGLDSGAPIEVNEAFWQERQRVLQERIAARKKAGTA